MEVIGAARDRARLAVKDFGASVREAGPIVRKTAFALSDTSLDESAFCAR